MSVVIVVKVSEGLVLAADSASTLSGRIQGPQGVQEGVLKTYYTARKLLQIGDFPIGLLAWGQAYIGSRTVESLVRHWEYDNGWQSLEAYRNKHQNENFKVKDCADGLRKHLADAHAAEFKDIPKENRPALGVIVAGYSVGGFFPDIWRFVLPFEDELHNQRPDLEDGKPDFGANWFGLTDAIVRLHWGRDEQAIKIISEKFNIPEQDILEALKPLQYGIPFAVMPLQDAIEYANYMLNVMVGRYRFVLGPELVGGKIDLAAITQNQFEWISQKSWGLK